MKLLKETLNEIRKPDSTLSKGIQRRLDNLTKPKGSLGRLEEIAVQIAEITGKENPPIKNKVIFTMAGDHGVTEEGVSAYPKEVTSQMVYNFIRGGAGINVLAKQAGARVIVVDMGIDGKLKIEEKDAHNFRSRKINSGTRNMVKGPAMSRQEAIESIKAGIEVFEEESRNGIDIAGIGEMGIGNTTSASAIACIFTGNKIEELTGRGTGINDSALRNKIKIIKKAIKINNPDSEDAIDVLSKVGGFEIGGMAGVILAAAKSRVPIVIDGFISSAAALIAYRLKPEVKGYMIAAHRSVEKGHRAILESIGLNPLLNLGLRLGEGTGAALAMNIIEASIKTLNEMATFQEAEVSGELKG